MLAAVRKKITSLVESSRRALRTLAQGIAAAAAFVALVAIPPVADAVNQTLALVGVHYAVTPGLVGALGALAAAGTAVASKIQNLIEHRDKALSPDEWAAMVSDLVDQLNAAKAAGSDVVHEAYIPVDSPRARQIVAETAERLGLERPTD